MSMISATSLPKHYPICSAAAPLRRKGAVSAEQAAMPDGGLLGRDEFRTVLKLYIGKVM